MSSHCKFCLDRESQQDDKKDPKRAAITERQNNALINRLIANGTTTALYFGTLRLDSTLRLAQQLAKVGEPGPFRSSYRMEENVLEQLAKSAE